MRFEGKIYRPWMEANSQLLQVTIGCTNNDCTFCSMFRDKKFKMRPLDDVLTDVDAMRANYPSVKSIFLVDGNVMVMPTKKLLAILNKIKSVYPMIENITLYSQLNDLEAKSEEEIKTLVDAGLSMAYCGLESGDAQVQKEIKKGLDIEVAKRAVKKAKKAGLKIHLSLIFGLGGSARTLEHISATTDLLNEVQPDEISPLALTRQSDTPLSDDIQNGRFVQVTPTQMLQEEIYLLENLRDFPMVYWGDNGNNMVPQRGLFPRDKAQILANVKTALTTHPEIKNGAKFHSTFEW